MTGLTIDFPPELVADIADAVAERMEKVAPPTKPIAKPGRLTLTKAEAAKALGISVDHFDKHIRSELRLVRSGRLKLVPVAELERWVSEQSARPLEA